MALTGLLTPPARVGAQSFDVTLYVDREAAGAGDTSDGSSTSPLRTIQEAMDRAIANKQASPHLSTRIVIRPGIYRELVDVTGYTNYYDGPGSTSNPTPILVEAEQPGTVVVSGADVFTGWQPDGGRYWHAWPHDWGPAENPWAGTRDMAEISLRREMVMVDGQWLRQVLAPDAMADGTFYVDEGQDRIYVDPPAGVDLGSALVEVAVRDRTWLQEYEHNVTIRGLTFRHAAEPWSDVGGSARFAGSNNLVIEDCTFEWNNYLGFQLLDMDTATLRRSSFNHNGADGWGMWESTNVLVEDSETSYNNWRGDLGGFYSWSVGNKILHVHGLTLRRHRAEHNLSRGLWIDEDNRDVLLDEVVLQHNLLDGIWLEANPGPVTVRNSTFARNGESGLRGSNTENVTLEGNLFEDNSRNQLELVGTGGREVTNFRTGASRDLFLQNWTLTGNAFAYGTKLIGTQYFDVGDDWPRFASTLEAGANTYWHPTDPEPFQVDSETFSWDAWKSEGYAGPGSFWTEPQDISPEPGYQPYVPDHALLSVEPADHVYGGVLITDGRLARIEISNLGAGDLQVADLAITGPNAAEFEIVGAAPPNISLAPGEIHTLHVRFSPAAAGIREATLGATTNDPDQPTLQLPLEGRGVPVAHTTATTYPPPDGKLPLYLGEPVGIDRPVAFSDVSLTDAVSVAVTLEVVDLDDPGEGTYFVNGEPIPWPDELVGTPDDDDPRRHTYFVDISLLDEGTNEIAFEMSSPVTDSNPYQYIVNELTLTVRYESEAGPGETATVALAPGWNLISSYLEPDVSGVSALFSPVADRPLFVKNQEGGLFAPSFGIDTIGPWQSDQAYMVLAPEATSFSFPGTAIDPQSRSIELAPGWNWAAYWLRSAVDTETALAAIAPVLQVVKDAGGNLYVPGEGIATLDELEPGRGYKMYVREAATLTYPADGAAETVPTSGSQTPARPGVASSAALVIEADASYDGQTLSVWANDRMVGDAVVTDGHAVVTIVGVDTLRGVVVGAANGDRLQLRRGRDAGAPALPIAALRDVLRGQAVTELHYEEDGVWAGRLDAAVATDEDGVPLAFALEGNYPNPFNPATTITYTLSTATHVALEVLNVLGQRVALLVEGRQPAGRHEVTFRAGGLASGVYLYRLQTEENVAVGRMMLAK